MRAITFVIVLAVSSTESRYVRRSSDCVVNELNKNIVVETTLGKLKGSYAKTETQGKHLFAFQSIPYAQPPVGELRFKYPKRPNKWDGILDATKASKVCLQPYFNDSIMSEDCLFLNIFTPCLTPSELLPVVLWVHGGYFLVGDGRFLDGEPDLFIDKDVVLVSINYRLGIFGYLSMQDDVLTGNYGIKDQIMALEWVQANIANFGGDPKRVTVMGQSAGAANVALLMQTPLSRDLFSAAIMDSGNSLNLWSRTTDPASVANLVANHFDIEYNSTDELKAALQKLDAKELLNGADAVDLINTAFSNPMDGLLFGPSVEPFLEGAVMGWSHENLKHGNFLRVPVLTGFNSAEGKMFLPLFDSIRILLEIYDLNPSRLAPMDLNTNKTLLKKIGKMIQSTYFQNKTISSSKKNFVKYITDHEFARPAIEFVRLVSKYIPTYFYRFDYSGELSYNSSTDRDVEGAVHGEELAYIFFHSDENTPSKADLNVRERLITMWTNFAKYHNPTPNADTVLQNVIWQPVKPTSINFLNIDDNLTMMRDPNKNYTEFWNSIYTNYGVPPFDTY